MKKGLLVKELDGHYIEITSIPFLAIDSDMSNGSHLVVSLTFPCSCMYAPCVLLTAGQPLSLVGSSSVEKVSQRPQILQPAEAGTQGPRTGGSLWYHAASSCVHFPLGPVLREALMDLHLPLCVQ